MAKCERVGVFDSSYGKVTEEICPTIAAWSDKPRTLHLEQYAGKDHTKERDGAVIKSDEDLIVSERNPMAEAIIKQSWIERFAGRLVGG